MGESQVIRDPLFNVVRRAVPSSQVKNEIQRLENASDSVIDELRNSQYNAVKAIGEQGESVFEAQILIAADRQFSDTVVEIIKREHVNAEYAYQEALAGTIETLEASTDPNIRQMTYDIRAVAERMLSFMMGVGKGSVNGFKNPTILIGRIFSPGQIMDFAKRKVVGFLTEEGGPTSHMGLIVRSLGLPAVMGEEKLVESLTSGTPIIIDGNNGEVIVNPDSDTWRNYRRIKLRKRSQPFAVLEKVKSIESVCLDGHEVSLAANLEIPGPLDEPLARLGIGVGLYRTEFLYFSKQAFPDEDEQYEVYSRILKQFSPHPVTLRTFDLGGDKYAAEFGNIREDNPALGWRGIRVLLEAKGLFTTQIRAMLRASLHGNLRIMLPMVSDVMEVDETLQIIDKIQRELRRSRIDYDPDIPLGIMIEVPSAALVADYLAEKVDFFSIGTNDLIQYTMAADRGNHRVARYYIGHHPALLQLIHMTVQAGHNNGIPVSVCGEIAASKAMAPFLVGLGIDELSMSPTQIPGMAEWISQFSYVDAKRFASRVLRLTTADKVSRALREAYEYVKNQKKGSWIGD